MDKRLTESTWRRACVDTRNAITSDPRFWAATVIISAALSVFAVVLYPEDASVVLQATISAGMFVGGAVVFLLMVLLANFVAWSPRGQRDEARAIAQELIDTRDWRKLLEDIDGFIGEANAAMDKFGRPSLTDSSGGLDFCNNWIPRVRKALPDEYWAEFDNLPRSVFAGDAVWALQLDNYKDRLVEITRDIRTRHLT